MKNHSLAGLLLFFFFPSASLSGSSCEFIESVCPTPGAGSAISAVVSQVVTSRDALESKNGADVEQSGWWLLSRSIVAGAQKVPAAWLLH